ncbi:MAG: hypothetical protein DRQ88_02405 [Epsilonproteobacteria bacterium]|nr:MAG: hypothetical protein DRQ89_02450 [Campylobacterota bacterium]RLA67520.1 MAG: hypothetical protein DRQ88_02405 [Campylobacterota bacterium]
MPINVKARPLNIKKKIPNAIPQVYKNIAQGMERQFLQYMLEKMKDTAKTKNQDTAGKYYQSLMTSEHAKIMASKNGGVGIQKLILKQIYPGYQDTTRKLNPGPKNIPKAYIEGSKL